MKTLLEPSNIELKMERSRKRQKITSGASKAHEEDSTPILTTTSSRITSKQRPTELNTANGIDLATSERSDLITDASFASLNVAPWLVASLSTMAITRPTGIQKGCIPKILDGRDVIGGSRTGSGKTVAFAVPILQRWAEDPVGIFAVVLTPTR